MHFRVKPPIPHFLTMMQSDAIKKKKKFVRIEKSVQHTLFIAKKTERVEIPGYRKLIEK